MKSKKHRLALTVLLALVMSLSLGLSFYTYNARVVNNNALPMPFGLGVSVVYSGSMEPTYSGGDLIFVTKADSYELGDVVVFQTNKKAVMHRIIEIDGDTVVTKGDANNVADEPIPLASIKGKVRFHIPFVGHIVRLMKTTVGTVLILATAIFLFEYPFIREKREQRKKREELLKEIEQIKKEK